MNYGLALLEKPGAVGLTHTEIEILYGLVSSVFSNGKCEVYPIEIDGSQSCAMGFITVKAAESIDFDYDSSGLNEFVSSILDDTDLENEHNHYQFKGIDIYLDRLDR